MGNRHHRWNSNLILNKPKYMLTNIIVKEDIIIEVGMVEAQTQVNII